MAKKVQEPKVEDTAPVVIDQKAVLLKMQAARVIASKRMPYLSVALFAMITIRVDSLFVNGVPTLATDDKWRLYYNPLAVIDWSVEELAGVLLHEVGHCLRSTSTRFKALGDSNRYHTLFNIASDALINTDLREDKVPLPGKPYYIESIKERHNVEANREMTTEKIYSLIREKHDESCTCNKNKSNEGEGNGKGEGNAEGNSESNGEGNGKGKGQGNSEGNGESNGESNGGGTDSNCPVHGCSHKPGGSGAPCKDCPPQPDCGSIADGIRRDYESEGEKVDNGVDAARADLVRQHVAVEIKNHAKNIGSVSAGLMRWAKDLTEPVIDWRRELDFIVRKSFAQVAGIRDYSYSRVSRRQTSMNQSGSNVILPAMRKPAPPKIAIVIDTSGSMSDDMLSWALSETKGVLRSIGSSNRDLKIISCDAQAVTQRITNISQVKLAGGGGTDMRIGINEAMKSDRNKPDAVVVITDGFTPWPAEPLRGTILIVALTDASSSESVPSWARKVLITREEKTRRRG